MLHNIHWLGHAGFFIECPKKKNVFIDPYKIKNKLPKADIILITHAHANHCSPADIKKIVKEGTVIIGPAQIVLELPYPVKVVSPGERLTVKDIEIQAVWAYNPLKKYHPREEGNLGFVVTIDKIKVYHAGDTDFIPEMKKIKADIAIVPIGGIYTMDAREAAEAVNVMHPAVVIPMHFVNPEREEEDLRIFQSLCKSEVRVLEREV
ncbi:MAG: MBL fold metallo-hydrolase [Candidatus Omnitrophota bacterium]|jgi:L-ascorbate metabolism protein UlaG (beta-lactamase superfamily)